MESAKDYDLDNEKMIDSAFNIMIMLFYLRDNFPEDDKYAIIQFD